MEELLKIQAQLLGGSINYKEAYEIIKKLPKAWTTAYWKKMREKHLEDKCSNCGSSSPPLVIQHTKQPTDFSIFYDSIMSSHIDYEKIKLEVIENQVTEKNVNKYLEENSQIRESCPSCGMISIRYNKKLNIYICSKNHTFEKPVELVYYTKSKTTDINIAKDSTDDFLTYISVSKKIREIKERYDLEVGREALLLSIDEGIDYLLFKNIKTCCKRCAAIEDNIVPAYILCKKCKVSYHSSIYETCFNCKEIFKIY
jgi:hypothetical protein